MDYNHTHAPKNNIHFPSMLFSFSSKHWGCYRQCSSTRALLSQVHTIIFLLWLIERIWLPIGCSKCACDGRHWGRLVGVECWKFRMDHSRWQTKQREAKRTIVRSGNTLYIRIALENYRNNSSFRLRIANNNLVLFTLRKTCAIFFNNHATCSDMAWRPRPMIASAGSK
jgi:hypothetical protein